MHKKTCRMSENVLFGGGGCRGSEKLLNFHHLQMMKNIEGGEPQKYILSLQRTQTQ